MDALPEAAQRALIQHALKVEAKPELPTAPLPDIKDLQTYQRDPMTARAAILGEIDRLVITTGVSQGRTINAVVELAAKGELAADLQRLVAVANARLADGRALSRATLYSWLQARAAGRWLLWLRWRRRRGSGFRLGLALLCNSSPGIDTPAEVSYGELDDGGVNVTVILGEVCFTEANGGTHGFDATRG